MNNKQMLPSKKQTICIIIFILTSSLACKSPDVARMVYDNFFGPENTRVAEEDNRQGTEVANIYKRIAEENTLHAEENNKQMTAQAI